MNKLLSRKFWLAVLAALCALFLMITGNIDTTTGMKIILASVGTYIGAEGLIDFGRALTTKKKK
jgi:hypothetical protein